MIMGLDGKLLSEDDVQRDWSIVGRLAERVTWLENRLVFAGHQCEATAGPELHLSLKAKRILTKRLKATRAAYEAYKILAEANDDP